MTWTTEWPGRAGWWWYWATNAVAPRVIEVEAREGGECWCYYDASDDDWVPLSDLRGGRFAGPIPPPAG
jgi:hypothetical protein